MVKYPEAKACPEEVTVRRGLRMAGLVLAVLAVLPWTGCDAIRMGGLEGCCYRAPFENHCFVLEATDGHHYELYGNNLTTGYLRVWGRERKDWASICMAGIIYEVDTFQVLRQDCTVTNGSPTGD